MHILYDCSTVIFLKQQINSLFEEHNKTSPQINIHDIQMFNQKKFLNNKENEDIKYPIATMKITLHNKFQSKQIMRDYTNEKYILNKFNHVLQIIKSASPTTIKYRLLKL